MPSGLQKKKKVVIIDGGAYDDEIWSGCDGSEFEVIVVSHKPPNEKAFLRLLSNRVA